MNYGKVSDNVYRRTVYKTIHTISYQDTFYNKMGNSAVNGADCAILPPSDKDMAAVTATAQASGIDTRVAVRALQHAMNHLAVLGVDLNAADTDLAAAAENEDTVAKAAAKAYISLSILLPAELREAKLRAILENVSVVSDNLKAPIVHTETQVITGIQTVIASVHVTAYAMKDSLIKAGKALPGQDVVMTKWLGIEGTAVIADKKAAELESRYPLSIIEEAASFDRYLSVIPEAATAAKSDVSAMCAAREGGIFGALWELAQDSGVGLVIDLRKIPVRQETIEVCEFYDINPYKLIAGGSLLITTDNGGQLVAELSEKGIPAAVIGRTTEGNDKILQNEDEIRYLEPAREDEIYKIKLSY